MTHSQLEKEIAKLLGSRADWTDKSEAKRRNIIQLLTLIDKHTKEVIGKDENYREEDINDEYYFVNKWHDSLVEAYFEGRNELRAEQRQASSAIRKKVK